ncbi:hypothetical protein BDM02DRAFT_3184314 [Thelephora ganbajun]|uniref:Uncharacterized protein n=1 Tax=Thelephora ganbajun TaxID=370292 RepID=A0ACB6ZQG2_THEGA|nr:hypothetical protein BDM02DRAFT_3184314 [Thelephora ganbajun]
MSDNHILSEKIVRLEVQLDKMRMGSNYSPGNGLDRSTPSSTLSSAPAPTAEAYPNDV